MGKRWSCKLLRLEMFEDKRWKTRDAGDDNATHRFQAAHCRQKGRTKLRLGPWPHPDGWSGRKTRTGIVYNMQNEPERVWPLSNN